MVWPVALRAGAEALKYGLPTLAGAEGVRSVAGGIAAPEKGEWEQQPPMPLGG